MKKKIYPLLFVLLNMQVAQLANAQCTVAVNTTALCTKDTLSATVSSPVYELQWKRNGTVVHTSNAAENKYGEIVAGGNGRGYNADQLYYPNKIFVDDTGNIYVADNYNYRVQKWAPGATAGTTVPDSYGYTSCVFVDKTGNIYFPNYYNNQIKKLAPGATTSVVVAGNGTSGSGGDQLFGIADLFVDDTGNIYIADNGNNRIQKWAPGATSGVTVAGGNGQGKAPNQFYGPGGIYVDKDNNIYVADHGNNRIQKWAPGATSGTTVVGQSEGAIGVLDVSIDADGNIYFSEDYTNSIKKYTPGDVKAVIIAGGNGYGSATNKLAWPQGLFVDGNGNVYASDHDNNRVLKFPIAQNNTYQYTPDQAGNYTVKASFTSGCNAGSNAAKVNASPVLQLSGITTICTGDSTTLTASGADSYSWSPATGLNTTSGTKVFASPGTDIIYTVTGNNSNGCSAEATAVLKVNLLPAVTITGDACSDTITATVANAASGVDWKLNGTTVLSADASWNADGIDIDEGYTYYTRSVFVDRNNNIYVSMGFEEENNIVLKFSPGNPVPDTVAGSSNYGNGANQLELPNDVWVDAQGNVYVADRNNGRVQKWAPGATSGVTVAYGSSPTGVAVDGFGNVYMVENTAHDVMKWAPGATSGVRVAGGTGYGSTADKLKGPIDVYVDGKGNLYITDTWNDRVQKWAPGATNGVTVAGGNGKGNAANQLNSPSDVYADEEGNVYVCDYYNRRIQKWAPGATSGVTIVSSYEPNGISFDKTGNLYAVTYDGDLLKHSPITDFKYVPQATGNYAVTATSIDGCSTSENVPECNDECKPPYNLTVSNIKAHSAHFQGSSSADAVLNQLRIREVGTAKWDKYSGSQMEVTLNNLDANTRYEWQARSKCDSGFSDWVAGPDFKTRRNIPFPPFTAKENMQPGKTGITVLPNPNKGNFNVLINISNKTSKGFIQLYDASGKRVYEENLGAMNGSLNKSINLQGRLVAGVYLLVVQTNNERYTEKVVIVQ